MDPAGPAERPASAPVPGPTLAPGVRLAERYRIEHLLGRGGMGEVYAAHDEALDAHVALKIILPGVARDAIVLERLKREVLLARAVTHPNVCRIHDWGNALGPRGEPIDFLTMELVRGEPLHLSRRRLGLLPDRQLRAISQQVAAGLDAAHRAGVVHRDFKSGNVLLAGEGDAIRAVITDFGLARSTEPSDDSTQLTATWGVLGTPAYMAPEQLRGDPADARSDLYAFGIVLFELLSGRLPFEGKMPLAATRRLEADAPSIREFRPDLSAEWEEVVRRLLARDPAKRPASATEALSPLEEASRGSRLPHREGRSRRLAVALALGAGLMALVLLAAGARSRQRSASSAPGPGPALSALALASTAPAGPGGSGLVLLPCHVLADPGRQFLTDAVPSTMALFLERTEGLDVRRPPTRTEVDPATVDMKQLAERYRVDRVVTCTVTADDQRILLALDLIEPGTQQSLWSHRYEGAAATYIDLVRRSADELRQVLRPGARPSDGRRPLPARSEVELELRRGLHHLDRFDNLRESADFGLAVRTFKHVIELDPQNARARAELGYLHLMADPADLVLAERLARDALAIEPELGRAWYTLATVEVQRPKQHLDEIIFSALNAVRFGPDDRYAYWAVGSACQASSEIFETSMQLAVEVDPLYAWGHVGLAMASASRGDSAQALASIEEALAIAPGMDVARMFRCTYLAALGRKEEALAALAALESDPERPQPLFAWTAAQLATRLTAGDERTRRTAARDFELFLERECGKLADCAERLAHGALGALARSGNAELALRVLETQLALGSHYPYDGLMRNPDLDSLRTLPGYPAVAARTRAALERTREILVRARSEGRLPDFLQPPLVRMEELLVRAPAAPPSPGQ